MSPFAVIAVLLIAQTDSAAPAGSAVFADGPVASAAPANPWKVALDAGLMTTQNAYSDSWSGGEAGSLSWAATAALTAQKQCTPRTLHVNAAKLAFGQTLSQNQADKRWNPPAKSTDLIDLESLLRLTLGLVVDPFASLRLETQFRDASDRSNVRSFNPSTVTGSVGVARTILKGPDRELTTRLGLSVKRRSNRGVLVDPVNVIRQSYSDKNGGLEWITDFKTPVFSDKVRYTAKLTAYQAFYNSQATALDGLPGEDDWRAPDVNWENALAASVSKFLMVNLYLQWLYDKEVDQRGRLKETLSLGLTYSHR